MTETVKGTIDKVIFDSLTSKLKKPPKVPAALPTKTK